VIGGKFSRNALGGSAFGTCPRRFLLGLQARGRLATRIGLVVGATTRFARRLALGRDTRQRGGHGRLVVAQPFAGEIGGAPLGLHPLPNQAFEFLFLARPGAGGGGQFGRGKFAALGIRQGSLLRLDPVPQRDLGQPLDVGLLRGRGLGRTLGRSTVERLLGREFLRLLAPLCGGDVLRSHELARLGGGARALVRRSPGQSIGGGGTLGVRRVCHRRGGTCSQLPALLFRLHQSRQ